ncbi:unnamed protein product [Lactuca saligna]|uniref:Uncharacterized protein n=1 Tax=Lactuca saligna TaxID=75948 RepID=A0AA35VH07_LACSI|nr:unnamed protein product [Lactuca saligna]
MVEVRYGGISPGCWTDFLAVDLMRPTTIVAYVEMVGILICSKDSGRTGSSLLTCRLCEKKGTRFEADEEMCGDDEDREALQETIKNMQVSTELVFRSI